MTRQDHRNTPSDRHRQSRFRASAYLVRALEALMMWPAVLSTKPRDRERQKPAMRPTYIHVMTSMIPLHMNRRIEQRMFVTDSVMRA